MMAGAVVFDTLRNNPIEFLRKTSDLHNAALSLVSHYLDPLASQISKAQDLRSQKLHNGRKRKRHGSKSEVTQQAKLKIRRIHTQGFNVEQVFHQSQRVIDAALEEIEHALPVESSVDDLGESHEVLPEVDVDTESEDDHEDSMQIEELGDVEDGSSEASSSGEASETLIEGTPPSDLHESSEDDRSLSRAGTFATDKNGLNDGFFSIDDFNKQTLFLEQQDARGDPDDGAASDEEDVDWTLDPFSMGNSKVAGQRGVNDHFHGPPRVSNEGNDGDDGDDDDGPTFGNADLYAPDSDLENDDDDSDGAEVEETMENAGDFSNTNDIKYADFFAPPPKPETRRRTNTGAPRTVAAPHVASGDNDDDAGLQRAINDVQRDLFEDEESFDGQQDDISEEDPDLGAQTGKLSTHARRQLALRAEIRRLEAENIANKPWAMTGETLAPARPENALLEEDLEFERAGKPVPVVTAETTESIEELIKRRILNKEFDEVVRRRPDDVLSSSDTRRGKMRDELSDMKPGRGLAEEYEQDYLKQNDPNYVDTRSEALKAKHKEIEQQWRHVSAQLDSLSNWHYKPRPPAANLEVRVDAPSIMLEDAQPAAAGGVGGQSLLAPQEVYGPGDAERSATEVTTKQGTAVAKEELSREDRKRRRRREKERNRKAESNKMLPSKSPTTAGAAKSHPAGNPGDVAAQLKKGNVKIINKKGGLEDIKGRAVKLREGRRGPPSGGDLKL